MWCAQAVGTKAGLLEREGRLTPLPRKGNGRVEGLCGACVRSRVGLSSFLLYSTVYDKCLTAFGLKFKQIVQYYTYVSNSNFEFHNNVTCHLADSV